jgi:hypothetical protein
MAEVPFWYDDPTAWDRCGLKAGETRVVLPGLCKVRCKRKLGAEKSKAPGTSGEVVKWTGKKNADLVIVCRIFNREQLAELGRVLPILESGKKSEQVWAITHPTAQLRGVASITIDEIDGPSDEGEIRTVTLSCFETPEPKKTGTGTAKGAGSKSICAQLAQQYAQAVAATQAHGPLDPADLLKAYQSIQAIVDMQKANGCKGGVTPSEDAGPPTVTGEV